MGSRLVSVFLVAATGAWAAGRKECAMCHAAQAQSQPGTPMSRALEPADACKILRENPKLTWTSGAYRYQIVRDGEQSVYTVTDGKETVTAAIGWAFGLGAAGQTYVYRWKDAWYESRVSFYKKIQGLDGTIGASPKPNNIEEAAGRLMSAQDVTDCFNCHAANVLRSGRTDIDHLGPGVQCERCHGASDEHLQSFKTGGSQPVKMRQLEKLTTEEISDFCGQCHRTWAQIAMHGPHNINNLRFQPYRLTNSKCYDTLDKRISCVACHDPHREAEHTADFYDAKCLACHGSGKPAGHTARLARKCPTAAKACVTCHMPKIELPGSHNLFADHWIRVVKQGAPYPD